MQGRFRQLSCALGAVWAALACAPEAPQRVPEETWVLSDVGFAQPDTVVHDPRSDVYLVSNVDGDFFTEDDNGFISRVSPDGRVLDLHWIDGGSDDATLHAPTGLALQADTLYVADRDTIRMFHRLSGRASGEFQIEDARSLRGLTVTSRGRLYAADSGLEAGTDGAVPAAGGALWYLGADALPRIFLKRRSLGNPVGLAADGDTLIIATQTGAELFAINSGRRRTDLPTPPEAGFAGLIVVPGGDVLVSSTEGSAIYRVPRNRSDGDVAVEVEVGGLDDPAGIGIDTYRSRIVIPLRSSNQLAVRRYRTE